MVTVGALASPLLFRLSMTHFVLKSFVYNTIERCMRPMWRAIHRSLIQMHHESIDQQRNGYKYNDYGNAHNCNVLIGTVRS